MPLSIALIVDDAESSAPKANNHEQTNKRLSERRHGCGIAQIGVNFVSDETRGNAKRFIENAAR